MLAWCSGVEQGLDPCRAIIGSVEQGLDPSSKDWSQSSIDWNHFWGRLKLHLDKKDTFVHLLYMESNYLPEEFHGEYFGTNFCTNGFELKILERP